jgi:hypothetical protein
MFERFTDRARRVVVLAQEEARALNHNYIGTEHILLGLVHEGEGVGAAALESRGISLALVRQQVEDIVGRGREKPTGHIPFTPRTKVALEMALREAQDLGDSYIGTEHLLLGLIREGDGIAAQVLVRMGADSNGVRQQVIMLLSKYQSGTTDNLPSGALPAPKGQQSPKHVASGNADCPQAERDLGEEPVPVPVGPPRASNMAGYRVRTKRADYADLDLAVRSTDHNSFAARVLNSPAGQTAEIMFSLPWSKLELENFLLRIAYRSRSVRRIDKPQTAAIKDFGSQLYNALFKDQIEAVLLRSLSEVNARGVGLRIRLRLTDAPALAALPWEFLYDRVRNRFLCLSERTPIVRFPEVPDPFRPLNISRPLKILVVISSPADHSALDNEQEWELLLAALEPLIQRNAVEIQRLTKVTLASLRRALRQDDWNVLHFVGHGGFDPSIGDGVLVFEDEQRRSRIISGQDLGILLHDHDSLRLVVLNACEGARADQGDPFSGSAQGLMQQGIPAVVAMQFEISDRAAVTLASEMYSAICDGYSLEAAVTAARKAIFTDGNQIEWATPVLYLRTDNGMIFNIRDIR